MTTPAHWTDGTTFQGQFDYGPPPLAAAWKVGDECHVALVDPPTVTFITVHDSHGGSIVVPYTASAPGLVSVDVSSLVEGHAGVLTLTWNIGTGVSAPFAYDCAPPSTTTTADPTTTTTTTTTVEQTTTSVASVTTTSLQIDPTTVPVSATTTTVVAPRELPHTGSTTGPLAGLGLSVVVVGAVLAALARKAIAR